MSRLARVSGLIGISLLCVQSALAQPSGFVPSGGTPNGLQPQAPTSSTATRSVQRASARSATADGQLSFRSYYSFDDSETYPRDPFSISFLETDLHARQLTDGGLSLDLDATFILDLDEANERRFGETERLDQVRQLSISHPLGSWTLSLGRRLLSYAGNAWVDGLEARLSLDARRFFVGVYGGLSPDRFDRSISIEDQAAGAYLELIRKGLELSAAYNLILKKGALDRHFVFQRAHLKLLDELYYSHYLILDLINGLELTTGLVTLDFSPTRALNFALNLSQYSLERYRDQTVYRNIIEPNQALILGNEVIDLVYRRARLSASLRVNRSLYHYQMLEYKWRAQDGREALLYTIGAREEDLFNTGIELDAQAQLMDGFRADTLVLSLTARRDLGQYLSMDARAVHFTGRTLDLNTDRLRIFDEAQEIYLVGGSLMWRPSKSHHVIASYDGVYELEVADLKSDEPLMIHTGMLRYRYLY